MTIGSFFAFFVFGFVDVLRGSTLSSVLEEMGYSYSRGGIIVMAAYFGFVAASLGTGMLADRVGKKAIIILAAVLFLGGIGCYGSAQSFPLFLIAFFCIGFACGSAELGANYIIIDVRRRNPGLYLNLLTAFYGLGSMLAPLYTGMMFKAGFGWREVYKYTLIVPFLLLAYFLAAKYPRLEQPQTAHAKFSDLLNDAFGGVMRWIYVLSFSYVAAEACIATWLIEHLKIVRAVPVEKGAQWLAVYFGGIMVGRFVGGFFVERIGLVKSMAAAAALSFVCIAAGVFGPAKLAFLLPATGLFLSIILPTATAFVSTVQSKGMGAILGVFFCFVGLGGMIGPWIAGMMNDWLGLRAGMMTAAFFCAVMLFSLVMVRKRSRHAK